MSALDPKALARARTLVAPKARKERVWPVLAAATLAAVSALTFATAMIIAPPVETESVAGTVE